MYNRYIPQPDGSHTRNRMPDPPRPTPAPPPEPEHRPPPEQSHSDSCGPGRPGFGIGSFFRQILPKDFDTGDLIVVLLLLLMAADSQDEQNSALLTLALYLFM